MRWRDDDACSHAGLLAVKLRSNRRLIVLTAKAGGFVCRCSDGPLREADDGNLYVPECRCLPFNDRLDTLCGNLAGFLISWAGTPGPFGGRTPAEVISRRCADLVKEIEGFQDVLRKFEIEAGNELPSVSDFLECYFHDHPEAAGWWNCEGPTYEGDFLRWRPTEAFRAEQLRRTNVWKHHSSKHENPWDLRTIPRFSIAALLDLLRERLEPGPWQSFGPKDYQHPWLVTPSGQFPRSTRSAAGLWVAHCLAKVISPGAPRDELAAYCARELVRAWSNMTGEAPPKAEGTEKEDARSSRLALPRRRAPREHGKRDEKDREVLEGINPKAAREKFKDIGA